MNRSTPLILLAAIAVVLAGLNVYQFLDRQALKDKLAGPRANPDAAAARGGGSPGTLASSSSGAKPTKSAADRPRPGSSGSGADGAPAESEGFREIAEQWAKMMENPAMKKQMLAQMDGQVGPALAALYEHLELKGEDLTHFKGLLAEQWMAQQQVGMKLMSAAGDCEKHVAIKEDLRATREATEEKVREFLNDEDDFDYFQNYQKEMPDRMELEQFASALEGEGLSLRDDQMSELLTAMGEERVASDLGDVNDPANWDFENFNDGTVVEVMGKMSDFHRRVQVRAGSVLDESQLKVLTTSQEQNRKMQEMGMKMGLQMMKNMTPEE